MCNCPWPGPPCGSAFEFENELPSMGSVPKDEWKTGVKQVDLTHWGTMRIRFIAVMQVPGFKLGRVAISA